ncbi:MAG TPA: hypothetical protein VGH63_16270, partial [Polyangia bacterium]
TLIASQNSPYGIAVDGTYVYWSNGGYGANDASLNKMPLAGGTATPLLTGLANGGTVRVDATGVYVIDTYTGIRKVPLCGGSPILIVPDTNYIDDMVVSSNSVIFVRESNGDIRYATK